MFVAHERVLAARRQRAPHPLSLARRCARRQAAASALARADDREPAAALVSHDAARTHAGLVAAGAGGRARGAPVALERRAGVAVDDVQLRWTCATGSARSTSPARRAGSAAPIASAAARARPRRRDASRGAHAGPASGGDWSGRLELRDPARWWPHTHGEPALYDATARRSRRRRDARARHDRLSRASSATTARSRSSVNGAPIFCRGACWTPLDPVTLARDRAALAAALEQARDAGMNMLRVGGTMVYESDDFYDLCDELGILRLAGLHVRQHGLSRRRRRLRRAASTTEATPAAGAARRRARALAVLCGNSEGEQQAAMWGAARERWSPRLFHEIAPALGARALPGRPLLAVERARRRVPAPGERRHHAPITASAPICGRSRTRAAPRSASPPSVSRSPTSRAARAARRRRRCACITRRGRRASPRDLGAGWDFDDVRDSLPGELFGVDPMRAPLRRSRALPRARTRRRPARSWRRRSASGGAALDLGRRARSGFCATCGRARAGASSTRAARRRRPGTTCGARCSRSAPTSATRASTGSSFTWSTIAPSALVGRARGRALPTAARSWSRAPAREIAVAPRAAIEIGAATLFDGFLDLSYAYRFGPPLARSRGRDGARAVGRDAAQAFHFPLGLPSTRELDVGLTGGATTDGDVAIVTLKTRRFAQSVAVEADGFIPDDAYFHLPPGAERTLRLRRVTAGSSAPFRGTLQPLNASAASEDRRFMSTRCGYIRW